MVDWLGMEAATEALAVLVVTVASLAVASLAAVKMVVMAALAVEVEVPLEAVGVAAVLVASDPRKRSESSCSRSGSQVTHR